MLPGQGLIGKLVLLIAEKLISREVTLAFDEKKRACRAFVELYHCLDRLEELNAGFIKMLEYGIEHGSLLIGDLQLLMPSVDAVSQRFFDIGGELCYALELLDPTLSEAVSQIYAGKGSFLLLVSHAIRYDDSAKDVQLVEYPEPSPKILNIDMSSYYEWVKTSGEEWDYEKEKMEWPQNLLRYGEIDVAFHKSQVVLTNGKSLSDLRTVLCDHGVVLSRAREKLREFIAAKFALEDILYVSKGMKRDEF